jgi:polyphosphate kinase 2 (PPK2 family)
MPPFSNFLHQKRLVRLKIICATIVKSLCSLFKKIICNFLNLIKKEEYEKELRKLQVELVKLQEWVKHTKSKVVIVFEGRDALGRVALFDV